MDINVAGDENQRHWWVGHTAQPFFLGGGRGGRGWEAKRREPDQREWTARHKQLKGKETVQVAASLPKSGPTGKTSCCLHFPFMIIYLLYVIALQLSSFTIFLTALLLYQSKFPHYNSNSYLDLDFWVDRLLKEINITAENFWETINVVTKSMLSPIDKMQGCPGNVTFYLTDCHIWTTDWSRRTGLLTVTVTRCESVTVF